MPSMVNLAHHKQNEEGRTTNTPKSCHTQVFQVSNMNSHLDPTQKSQTPHKNRLSSSDGTSPPHSFQASQAPPPPQIVKWRPLPHPLPKLNIDRAAEGNLGPARGGGII